MINNLNKFLFLPLDSGIPENISFEEKKKLRVLNLVLVINLFFPFFFILSNLYYGLLDHILIEIIISLTFLFAYLLKSSYKLRWSKFILLFIVPLELFYFPLFVGNIGIEYIFFIYIYAGFYFLDNKAYFILHVVFISIILILSKYLISNSVYPEDYKSFERLFYYSNVVITVLLGALSVSLFKYDTKNYQITIEDQAKELKNKVQELEKREKILTQLFKELNHRVKNNLQMVSGLFTMQMYSSQNKDVKIAFNGVTRRLDAIALLHQHLYKKSTPFKPNLKIYLNELTQSTLHLMNVEEEIELSLNVDSIFLKIEVASHIGLIVNELLMYIIGSDTRKKNKNLKLNLEVNEKENKLNIHIQTDNNKIIFLKETLFSEEDSFRIKLIYAIIQQFDGSIEFFTNNSQIKITLHIKD